MAKHKFIAKINLKGDFDAEDGLGVAMQEIAAGTKASTDDKKLYDSLIAQGYAKSTTKKGEEEDDGTDASQSDPTKAPAVKTAGGEGDKTGGKAGAQK